MAIGLGPLDRRRAHRSRLPSSTRSSSSGAGPTSRAQVAGTRRRRGPTLEQTERLARPGSGAEENAALGCLSILDLVGKTEGMAILGDGALALTKTTVSASLAATRVIAVVRRHRDRASATVAATAGAYWHMARLMNVNDGAFRPGDVRPSSVWTGHSSAEVKSMLFAGRKALLAAQSARRRSCSRARGIVGGTARSVLPIEARESAAWTRHCIH